LFTGRLPYKLTCDCGEAAWVSWVVVCPQFTASVRNVQILQHSVSVFYPYILHTKNSTYVNNNLKTKLTQATTRVSLYKYSVTWLLRYSRNRQLSSK